MIDQAQAAQVKVARSLGCRCEIEFSWNGRLHEGAPCFQMWHDPGCPAVVIIKAEKTRRGGQPLDLQLGD